MVRESSLSEEAVSLGLSACQVIESAFESRRAFTFLPENWREYGDIIFYEFLGESTSQLNHPDDIEWVLVENYRRFQEH